MNEFGRGGGRGGRGGGRGGGDRGGRGGDRGGRGRGGEFNNPYLLKFLKWTSVLEFRHVLDRDFS